jgi:mRNA interferase MazF
MKRGDVVLMIAPRELGMPRPAVVIQTAALGSETTTIVVCPLTSDLTEKLPVRPLIEPNADNGLRLPSQVMTDKISAVRRDRISATLGALNSEALARVNQAQMIVLALAR